MINSQYDAVLENIEGTGFTGYYKKGINLKLSDGTTVINIWKPGKCPSCSGEVYKDAMIQFSGHEKNNFTYQDMKKINYVIELAIDYLNKENENIIERNKQTSYESVMETSAEKKKTKAIKYADLQVGGVYLDEKMKKWIFLGQGNLKKDGDPYNRIGCNYLYMKYPEKEEITRISNNLFKTENYIGPDSYSSKKRFFEKVDQLEVNEFEPINIRCSSVNYEINCLNPTLKKGKYIDQDLENKNLKY